MLLKAVRYIGMAVLIVLIFQPHPSPAANSSLTEQEAKTLGEQEFTDVVARGNCIVMYYNPAAPSMENPYSASPQALGDRFMRGMLAIKDAFVLSVKFYKVNWKNFSEHSRARIAADIASASFKKPESPSFASYARGGKVLAEVRGMPRPDLQAWYINRIMGDFAPFIRSEKDEYLRAGWAFTDTNASYISLADMRYETMTVNGTQEKVRVVVSRSKEYDDLSCEYEQFYLPNGRLYGSIEHYGRYGTVGYFDYDGTGKMQYRVKFASNGEVSGPTATGF